MDELVKCLAPAFAAGFAVQRLLEVVDSVFGGFPKLGDWKKLAMVVASLILATVLSLVGGLHVLTCISPVGSSSGIQLAGTNPANTGPSAQLYWTDLIVTILFISGGTEGFNALLKFLNYKK